MNKLFKYNLAAWCLTAIALILILKLKLLGALISGLLVHELVHLMVPSLRMAGATQRGGKIIALIFLITIIATLVAGAAFGLATLLAGGPTSIVALMQKMADILQTARSHMPLTVQEYLPANAAEIEIVASNWLRDHAGELKTTGANIGRMFAYIIIGIIIGSLVAFSEFVDNDGDRPLTRALKARTVMLSTAFRRIAYAQVRISALNTLFTAIYLAIVLPLCGVHLPLVKTMIVVTFIGGLIPLVGNLISNTVIVVLSLNASLGVAIGSLVFLVVIHKLEYFINAQIIGSRIQARAWELLLAMLVMEAAFGLTGLVAAPIYYAYLKHELTEQALI